MLTETSSHFLKVDALLQRQIKTSQMLLVHHNVSSSGAQVKQKALEIARPTFVWRIHKPLM